MNNSDTIPFIAYLNYVFIDKLAQNDVFKSGEMEIAKQYDISYFYHNEAETISRLYCLLVVPKEVWGSDQKYAELLGTIDESKTLSLFSFVRRREINLKYTLRSLRNSVSHARFISESKGFTFWDVDMKGVEHFRVFISHQNLNSLIADIGLKFAQLSAKIIIEDNKNLDI
jgi:hypothetical protein